MNAMQPPQSVEEVKATLETTEKGGVRQSIRNCLTVFQRDPVLAGAIAYNILTDRKDIMGEKIYCEALRLIVAAWDGKPDSFRASVLRGVMHFVELYHGEFSEERLIRALGSVHPMEIYRVGRDNPAKLPGWKKYVFPIYMAYNGKGRKDALPMKF